MLQPYCKNTAYWRDPCSLDWLIYILRVDEDLSAKQAAAAGTGAALSGSADAHDRIRIYRDRQTIDCCLANFPGIDRIKLLCYKLDNDKGLTAANVIKLLVKICDTKDCLPEAAKLLPLDEAADVLAATKGTKSVRKSRRGRKPDPELDANADKRLCENWKAAKRQGMTRKAFAREKGIRVSDLISAMDRERYRRRRDEE